MLARSTGAIMVNLLLASDVAVAQEPCRRVICLRAVADGSA